MHAERQDEVIIPGEKVLVYASAGIHPAGCPVIERGYFEKPRKQGNGRVLRI